jgi:hypothetical protein
MGPTTRDERLSGGPRLVREILARPGNPYRSPEIGYDFPDIG